MLSLEDLARERGVSKAAISKNITRWTSHGAKIATRKRGQVLLINADDYDQAKVNAGTNPLSHEQSGIKVSPTGSYAQEQARKIGFEAELKRLELEERLGNLIPREELQKATEQASEAVLRSIDHAVMRVDELQEASARGGVAALRVALKGVIRDVKTRCADALVRIATPDATGTNGATDE